MTAKKSTRKRWLKRLLRLSLWAAGVILSLGLLFIGLVNWGVFGSIPSKQTLRDIQQQNATRIYAQEGTLIGKLFVENRTSLEFEDFPPHLIDALIATEDARFYDHSGVDTRSLLRVFIRTIMLGDESAGGGSTLTQQLAKNLYGRKQHGWLTLPVNKTKEAIVARRLENLYTKEEILTLYLNTVPFGEEVFGVEAAAQRYFNTTATQLAIEEAAVLVGMLKANTYFHPKRHPERSKQRRNVVLQQMVRYDYLDQSTSDSLQHLPLVLDYANLESQGPAPYALPHIEREAKRILDEWSRTHDATYDLNTEGWIIHTTLQPDRQQAMVEAMQDFLPKRQAQLWAQYQKEPYKRQLYDLARKQLASTGWTAEQDSAKPRLLFDGESVQLDTLTQLDSMARALCVLQAGMVMLDPNTGAVRAWVGGIDHALQPYDQVVAKRTLASTIKPVLYAAALEQGVDPCLRLDNDPIVLEDYEQWRPKNYDATFGGSYSMRGALANSKNLPTIQLLFHTGFAAFDRMWAQMGFSVDLPGTPAAALGAVEGSALEVAVAYAAFANGGQQVTPYLIDSIISPTGEVVYRHKVTTGKPILSPRTARQMTQLLAYAVNQGTGSALRSRYGVSLPLAGKTGTAQNNSDAWFTSFTTDAVLVTRVGAAYPEVHFASGSLGSGSTLALPLAGKAWKILQRNGYSPSNLPLLKESEVALFHCPDYQPPSRLDNWLDWFKRDKTTVEKEKRRAERREKWRQFWRSIK